MGYNILKNNKEALPKASLFTVVQIIINLTNL